MQQLLPTNTTAAPRTTPVATATAVASPPSLLQQVFVGAAAGVLAWLLVEHVAKPATASKRRRRR